MTDIQDPSPYLFQMHPKTQARAGAATGGSAGASASNKPGASTNWFQYLWKGAGTGASAVSKAPAKQHPKSDQGGNGRIGRPDPKAVQKRQEIAAERPPRVDVGHDGCAGSGERRAAVEKGAAGGPPWRMRL